MRLHLGILDFGNSIRGLSSTQRIAETVNLCRQAEEYGFNRYWLGEHHTARSVFLAPEVIIPVLAMSTKTICIGQAGVLLQYYSPLKVAEVFLTLSAAFPKRIDLGVCRGPGVQNQDIARELSNSLSYDDAVYSSKLRALNLLLTERCQNTAERQVRGPFPLDAAAPRVWSLGSSERSALDSNNNCTNYAFMCCFPGSEAIGPELVRSVGARHHNDHAHLHTAITVSLLCASTDAKASERDAHLLHKMGVKHNIAASPLTAVRAIEAFAGNYGVDEVLLTTMSNELADHRAILEVGRLVEARNVAVEVNGRPLDAPSSEIHEVMAPC